MAGYTLELAPRIAARMTLGAEVAAAHPAVIRTIRVRTEMLRYGDRAPAASGEDESGWRSRGAVGATLSSLRTRFAMGLVD